MARRQGPSRPQGATRLDGLLREGEARLASGDEAGALTCFRRAATLAPNDPRPLFNAARAENLLFQPGAAKRDLRRALRLDPDNKFYLCEYAYAEMLNEEYDAALATLDKVLARDPDESHALWGKADFLKRLGRLDEAYSVVASAYERGVREYGIVATYAELAVSRQSPETAIGIVEDALRAIGPDVTARAMLCNRLSIGLARAREYERAFEFASRMNMARRPGWDREQSDTWFEKRLEACTAEVFAQLPDSRVQSEMPVFVVGMPRSGTSLIEQMLDCHPQIYGAGELRNIPQIVAQLFAGVSGDRSVQEQLLGMQPHALESRARAHLRFLRDQSGGASRVIDKLPANILHLPEIKALFPKARVLHSVRDPRDTCLSCYMTDFGNKLPFAMELVDLAHVYAGNQRLMRRYKESLELPILDVVYEDLVAEPERVIREVLEFLGVGWNDACLRHHESTRIVRTASEVQARQPIYRSSAGRWRNYEQQLQPLIDELQSLGEL